MSVHLEQETDREYTVVIDGVMVGTYIPGSGLIFISSEGSALSLVSVAEMLDELLKLESSGSI